MTEETKRKIYKYLSKRIFDTMELTTAALHEKLKMYCASHRKLTDDFFADDTPPVRIGVYDDDDETLCHKLVTTACNVPGCNFTSETLLEYENHYNSSHRYSCAQCKKLLPSPHLLDLHVQENHDSFFAVLKEKKPSYCCYIEECKEKFNTSAERLDHCVTIHKLPKDFRFESKKKHPRNKTKVKHRNDERFMDVDTEPKKQDFKFSNSKAKTFSKYTGRKFTDGGTKTAKEVNMKCLVDDMKENLPE